MTAKNKDTLFKKLRNLQCSFNLQINSLRQREAKLLVNKFKREYECDEYNHPEEKKRYYNLMTYLHYRLRNIEEAKQCNEMALEIDPESIVALGNQAWILYLEDGNAEDFKSVEQILQQVDVLFTNRVKLVVAKSEMAYSYARFGRLYYAKSESIYENVLNDVECSDKLPVFLWQYGCGLIKNRLLRQDVIHDDTRYEDTIKRAASLLSQVAKQDENLRFKARAWAELGNLADLTKASGKDMADCGQIEEASEMFSKAIQLLQDNNILDIPVLEKYAYHCDIKHQTDLSKSILFNTIKVKESARAFTLLSRILYKQMKNNLKGNLIPDNNESKQILEMLNSAIAGGNHSAMGFKGMILMQMRKYKEAIEEFEKVYRSLELTDPQQEELDWKTKVLSETCHAKCLYRSPTDADSIKRAKKLLWSAIELSFDAKMEDQEKKEQLKHPVYAMLKLLSGESKTPESILEEIIMYELVGKKYKADRLRRELEIKKMSSVQPEMAQRLIKMRQFNEGLFLLNQMIVSNTLPEDLKEFAIEANINGATYALENGDVILARRRALFAFDIRFPNDKSYIPQERLHVFLLANNHNQELAQSVQECITNWSSLYIITQFDQMPGEFRFSSLEEKMLQSSVLAILFDENDMKNDDVDSRFFQISVEIAQFVQIKYMTEKSLMVITVTDQSVIPDRLSYVPRLPLGKLFQEDKKKWMHNFFRLALLK